MPNTTADTRTPAELAQEVYGDYSDQELQNAAESFADAARKGSRFRPIAYYLEALHLAALEINRRREVVAIAFPNTKTPKRPLCATDTDTVELMLDAAVRILVDRTVVTQGWDRERTVAAATQMVDIVLTELEERDYTNAAQALDTDEEDGDVVLVAGYWRQARRARTYTRIWGPASELVKVASAQAAAYHRDAVARGIDPDELV